MARLAGLARQGALSVEDMEGGTFTISNGGVFGSLFGTPIINPPQSAILGMHGTFERPVAINGKVEVSTTGGILAKKSSKEMIEAWWHLHMILK